MRRGKLWRKALLAAMPLLAASACRSSHIDIAVANRSDAPVRLLEVDYPSASFGADAIGANSVMQYRIQVRGSGPLKVQYTTADGHLYQSNGPFLQEGQAGSIQIDLLPGGKARYNPILSINR